MAYLQKYFKKILDERKLNNSSYSMRSLARDLKIPVSQMSSILNGKVGISAKKALEIAEILKLKENEKEELLLSIKADFSKNKDERQTSAVKINKKFYKPLSEDVFNFISDWQHFAILELTRLPEFDSKIESIVKYLGISKSQAEDAIARLVRLKLLGVSSRGKLYDLNYCLISPDEIPSKAVRESHKQLIEKAKNAIEAQSVEERDFNAHIMAIEQKQIPEFKKIADEFFSKAAKLSAKAKKPDEVYCLEAHLFKITK